MPRPPSAPWSVLVTEPASGAENMALDEALMARAADTGEWVLRVYGWATPTLSLGRNQTARDRYDLDRLAADEIGVVRRPTGGRAILHHREITYSVTGPSSAAEASRAYDRASYTRINRILVSALDALGASVMVATTASARAIAPGMSPCFDVPAAGELTFGGRKIAGSAQWRSEGALLQHGSILVDDDQSALARYSLEASAPIPEPATLADALGWRPSLADAAAALTDAVRSLEDPSAAELSLDDQLRARAAPLVVRYLDPGWTWRR